MTIQESKRNQLANARNPFQGDDLKVLCVCSAGLLRSPTLARFLTSKYGYNTRAVGTSQEFALIPISKALILWADRIIFVDQEAYDEIESDFNQFLADYSAPFYNPNVAIMNIPDEYEYNDDRLVKAIEEQYDEIIEDWG